MTAKRIEVDDKKDHRITLDATQRKLLQTRKELHATLNDFISARGGWLVSVAGESVIRFEVPAGSALPADLKKLEYNVMPVGNTMRIVPNARLELLTVDGSTGVRQHWHEGIIKTDIYEIPLGKSS
jgi:hypothetical protein